MKSARIRPPDGRTAVRALDARINPLWDRGRNALIGWRPCAIGIEVLMVPYRQILDHFQHSRRLLHGKRLLGDGTFRHAVELTGCRPAVVALPFRVSSEGGTDIAASLVEQVLARYSITETLFRGVTLFDIVGFSTFDPMHQVAQLNSLEVSINNAHSLLQQTGLRIDLARSTTGDGYYLWNRTKGLDGDIASYAMMLLTLADNAMARREYGADRVPRLRACYSISSHYSYYQVESLAPRGYDYIVGDVTIKLARMIEKCLPGQILIGDFRRPLRLDEERQINPVAFVIRAMRRLSQLRGLPLQDAVIESMRCYLTGREFAPDEFNISRYELTDKHGYRHAAFNQKLNLYVREPDEETAKPIYLGKRTVDLAAFDASETDFAIRLHKEVREAQAMVSSPAA